MADFLTGDYILMTFLMGESYGETICTYHTCMESKLHHMIMLF